MAQYINKSTVMAEIEKLQLCTMDEHMNFYSAEAQGEYNALSKLESFLDTLDVKDVDLEKVISQFIDANFEKATIGHKLSLRRIAKHFFELGLNSQTKDMKEALRTEYEKGRADVLRCIDPDVMVADFCSQPLAKTRSIASIYRQGIIDILKRINNNEKTSINSTSQISPLEMAKKVE